VKGKTSKSPCKQCVTYAQEITSGVTSGDGSVQFSWTSDSDQFDGC